MAINGDALLQAARGTVFTAPAKTSIPTAGVKQFLLNSGSEGRHRGHSRLG